MSIFKQPCFANRNIKLKSFSGFPQSYTALFKIISGNQMQNSDEQGNELDAHSFNHYLSELKSLL